MLILWALAGACQGLVFLLSLFRCTLGPRGTGGGYRKYREERAEGAQRLADDRRRWDQDRAQRRKQDAALDRKMREKYGAHMRDDTRRGGDAVSEGPSEAPEGVYGYRGGGVGGGVDRPVRDPVPPAPLPRLAGGGGGGGGGGDFGYGYGDDYDASGGGGYGSFGR